MLFLTEDDVRALLPMTDAIRLMRDVFSALASGHAQNQSRRRLVLPTGAALHSMAGAHGPYFGTKIYSTHPKHGMTFHFHLYDSATARPLALMEANWLGQIRTGAASGLATELLARDGAASVAVIGSGFQARSQLEAVRAVRKIRVARVWSRDAEKRRRFGKEMAAETCHTAEAAVHGADIVITATNAKEPVLEHEWVATGAHVNAMGSNQARRRELPAALIERAALVAVDSIEQSRYEAGDLLMALAELASPPNVVELSDVVAGRAGRRGSLEITIFKSCGIGVEDVAAGGFVYERALAEGVGRKFQSP